MEIRTEKLKNRSKVNSKPIISVLAGLGFLTVILISTMAAAAQSGNRNTGSGSIITQTNKIEVTKTPSADDKELAVVEGIDTDKKEITLFNVDLQEYVVLSYTGGTDIEDKYGQVISMSQIDLGCMVDVSYEQGKNKLTSMNISTRAWEYPGVNNMSINLEDKVMKIASTKYKYTDDIFILDGQEVVPVDKLAEQDQLTVWGDEETIWSITITKGHGTVMLRDYEDYIGDSITIGYESMQQITEDLAVTVREGTFNLTVENGRYSATKSVSVERNKITYVSLADLGPDGLKLGSVTFKISPEDADLYIDRKLTTYTDPVDLTYGEHTIAASLGGYTTYEGTIDVDSRDKTISITLPQATSNQDAVATETDTGSDSDSDTSNTDTTNTDTTNTDTTNTDTTNSDTSDTDNTDSGTDSTDDTQYSSEDTEYNLDDGDSIDKDHSIYIKSPDGASVYLDGEYMGTAPCQFDKIIGNHVMTFIKDGYETTSYTIDVSDDGVDAYFTFPDLEKSK